MASLQSKALLFLVAFTAVCLTGCKETNEPADPIFIARDAKSTGLDFSNKLTATASFNMFKYMYFYNGAGAGAGDFNNDGLIDLFFASNQGENKLFLNEGKLKFRDVSKQAAIPQDGGWSTGVSVCDINSDGLTDIYVCRVGNFETLQSHNQLLICQGIDKNGIPSFKDEAQKYGLDFSGFSTHAAFFDYDLDGDLDMYLLNHSLRFNGTFSSRDSYTGSYDSLSGDRLYRNDSSRFTDVTKSSGINSSIIGYGLGIAVCDVNLDGLPDLYIGNDFHENDYLYINQGNGQFKDQLTECMMHTSQFSMGVDVADINNDAWPEVVSMDMLPSDPYILKRSLGEDEFNTFFYKIRHGYNYQYARNNLQLNRGNNMFSEIGLYSGIYATDWSWGPLWMDFDNDGLKDLFVSNGIPKRLNDMDYINYVSNSEVQEKIRANQLGDKDMALIDKFPEIKLRNKFFRNTGNAMFQDMESGVTGDEPSYSNGSVYADFDNDGDLDIVVNNISDPVVLYQNTANDKGINPSFRLLLKGSAENINAVGARVISFKGESVSVFEKTPVHGFQSSMEIPLQFGVSKERPDSLFLVWPDNSFQKIVLPDTNFLKIEYSAGSLPAYDFSILRNFKRNRLTRVDDITTTAKFDYLHIENPFVEFDREPLIPHMVSREGPGIAVGDFNSDGLDDVFMGSAKGLVSALMIQEPGGTFRRLEQPVFRADSMYEDVDAIWIDVNKDQHPDLIVASGGNEFYGKDEHLLPRVYINDGNGKLSRKIDAFAGLFFTASCVAAYDFTGDGIEDLFLGGRVVPYEYGEIPRSALLANDGTGKFIDVTSKYAAAIANIGFVTQGLWNDIDQDGDKDLLVCAEWGGINLFVNNKGSFSQKEITGLKGWWNFMLPVDVDLDGDIDLVAGNLGLNSRLTASVKEPVRLYYNDFDGNGKKEQVLTYYVNGKEIPFANKAELDKQIPLLKKKFLYAEDFARSGLTDLFSTEKLKAAVVSEANYFSNAILINDGKLNFKVQALPWQAQLTSFRDAIVVHANNDTLPEILLGGNFYENNIQMGRYDADFGTVLVNKGKGIFSCENLNGAPIRGQVRHIRAVKVSGADALILARNGDSTKVIRFIKESGSKGG